MKAAFLAAAVLATASVVFYFSTAVHAAKASGPKPATHKALASKSFSLPLFFEPNQGQTAPQVKFLARGAGYGLFLTADEAVLELQPSAVSHQPSASTTQPKTSSVIRMRLDGANSSARVSGASPLPGKSNYFIGNDPSKWRHDIPQFARVQYQAVYPGVDLVYYGDQGQLEYDFRVAPGAEPNQIALSFQGASARIVSGDSGDLILATANGDVRFHAPHVYQPAAPQSGNSSGNAEKAIAGSFRQLADNKIGFTIGDYDRNRELVIDPTLSYSTYLGGSGGNEGFVQVAVDSDLQIYVAGSTTSANFPLSTANNPNNPPYQTTLNGAQNIFIAVINPTLVPPTYTPAQQLVYATYLGGEGADTLAGLAVDSAFGIYVAGTTTSTNFPTTSNAFQTSATFAGTQAHGFLSKIAFTGPKGDLVYSLTYSTYLAGNGTDTVAGLAIDTNQNAYVTGNTTSSNPASDYFPANPNGYQLGSNSKGNPQFFASKINTNGSGQQSMLYSTYFGGGYPDVAIANCPAPVPCGGVAVDASGNMYITGTTNMLPVKGPNGELPFPLLDAQQPCLNQGSTSPTCSSNSPTTLTDAFVAKFNPNYDGTSSLIYSTYLGGNDVDTGLAIAVDSTGNAYVTGSTQSTNWVCACGQFQTTGYGGNGDAFIAKIGNLTGSVYPLIYFTYLGGSGVDVGNAIQVDPVGSAHVAGSTSSTDFPITTDTYQSKNGGGDDAFVASISTSSGGTVANPVGDFSTYLGGSGLDQGTGVALDIYGATYVAGNTQSTDFPLSANPFQAQLNQNSTDAFVSKIGAVSTLALSTHPSSPSPNPAAAGTQVAFTFDITNKGPDNASQVNFYATVLPNTGLASLASSPTGKMTTNTGSCSPAQGQGEIVPCFIPTLAAGAVASVEIDVTTNDTTSPVVQEITASGSATANASGTTFISPAQQVNVVDFTIQASPGSQTTTAGNPASTFQVTFCPTSTQYGYSGTITPSQTTSPSMVTATTPTFNPTTVTLSGSACAYTTLSIATVTRPVTIGSLLRLGSFYAAWLPIGGLSLVGLGIGAGRKRRRWLVGAVLCLIAGAIVLQSGCGSSSSSVTPTGGTAAGNYVITITGSAGTGASHTAPVTLIVR